MPNKPSAIKELRKTKKRTAHNARIKMNVKALHKKCLELLAAGKLDEAKKAAALYQKAIDKAALHMVVSKNRSNRKKSALMRAINKK